MKLRKNERCPIHNRYWCCGREQDVYEKKRNRAIGGVTRIEDEHHPRGYREHRSPSAMRILLMQKVDAQEGKCALCGEMFEDMSEVSPDHIEPRGMGGARRDDHPSNIQAAHKICNNAKGSRRLA